jgi:hypothetical protein
VGKGRWEVGCMNGGSSEGLLFFVVLVCVLMYFCCFSRRCSVRGLGLCKVGILGWSVGDECVGGRCSLVTG